MFLKKKKNISFLSNSKWTYFDTISDFAYFTKQPLPYAFILNEAYYSCFYTLFKDLRYAGVSSYKNYISSAVRQIRRSNKNFFFSLVITIEFNYNPFLDIESDSDEEEEGEDIDFVFYYRLRKKSIFYLQFPFSYFYNKRVIKNNPSKRVLNPRNFFFNLNIAFFNYFFFKGDYYRLFLLFYQYSKFYRYTVDYYRLYKLASKIKYKDTYNNLFYFVNKINLNLNVYNLSLYDLYYLNLYNINHSNDVYFYLNFSNILKPLSNYISIFNQIKKDYFKKYSLKRKFSYIYRLSKKARSRIWRRHRRKFYKTRFIFLKTLRLLKWQKLNYYVPFSGFKPSFLKSFFDFITSYFLRLSLLKHLHFSNFNSNYYNNPVINLIKFFNTRKNRKLRYLFRQRFSRFYCRLRVLNFRFLKVSAFKRFNKIERKDFSYHKLIYKKWMLKNVHKVYKLKSKQLKFLTKYRKYFLAKTLGHYYLLQSHGYFSKFFFFKKSSLIFFKNCFDLIKFPYLDLSSFGKGEKIKSQKIVLSKFSSFSFKNLNYLNRKLLLLLYIKYKNIPLKRILKMLKVGYKKRTSKKKKKKNVIRNYIFNMQIKKYMYFFIYMNMVFFKNNILIKGLFFYDIMFFYMNNEIALLFKDLAYNHKHTIAYINNIIIKSNMVYNDHFRIIKFFFIKFFKKFSYFLKIWKVQKKIFFFKRRKFFTRYSKKRKYFRKLNYNNLRYPKILRLFEYKYII